MPSYETPSLPEGYYFKVDVCTTYPEYGYLRVRLMRKCKWWFDATITTTEEVRGYRETVHTTMVRQAKELHRQIESEALHGNYPPKKL